MLTAFNVAKTANEIMTGFFLLLDGIVYWVIGILFDLYYSLSGAEIINNSVYEEIANRIMVIIGVVMLFYLAYALLKAVVNPDELTKNTQKIVTNLVISLVLIVIVPTIFNYAFRFQNIIMSDHVIDKIVFGNSSNTMASIGKSTAMHFFDAFIEIDDSTPIEDYANWASLQTCILDNGVSDCKGTEGFRDLVLLKESIVDGNTEYTPIVSTLCGVFLAYVIASFCLDLGLRVVKLAFYQIISPIPIMMRIIPEKKSVFDNWVKATMATYLEVFIRLFIMYIITFLCAKIFQDGVFSLGGGNVNIFGKIIIVLGIIAFAKQAPKLIGDVIGVNSGNIKLGIRDKLATGGAFTAGAILGGGITTGVRNLTHGVGNIKNANGIGNKFKAGFGMLGSAATGVISGATRSGRAGWNAKSATDMKKAATTGAQDAVKARENRAAYKASHGGTVFGAMGGHIMDTASGIGSWAGVKAPLEQLQVTQGQVREVADARKAVDDKLNSILEREKNSRTLVGPAIAGVGGKFYTNYADLLNDMEIMKSTGTYTDSSGRQQTVTGADLTAMANAEFEMKKQMKKEILNGYDKNGNIDMSKYDASLKEAITAYRTKSLQNYQTIASQADASVSADLAKLQEQAITNQKQGFDDFITSGNAFTMYDDANKAIKNASGNINNKVAKEYQSQQKKQGN